jgi:hypothetical protein
MPTGFNAAFASPWSSSFSTVQNPWLQRVNQYGMSGNPWGTMNSWSTSPFGSWMSNPYFAANAFTGNPWAFSGAPAFPYATPFAYGTAIAPTFGASPGFTVALMSHSQLCLRAITVDITLRVMGGCRCTHHAERDVYGNHAM